MIAILALTDGAIDHKSLMTGRYDPGVRYNDRITLLGYPGHAPGKGLSIKNGEVHSFTIRSTIRRFNISASIVAGSSGGPVLNSSRRVVGVAVTGADNPDEADQTSEHGVIPISALDYLGD